MDPTLDDISAICNSLGKIDENDGTYMKDRDCEACLREISRYLGADKKHDVRCFLGTLNVIKSDLIPLMNQYCDPTNLDLFSTILRICVNLTSPIEIVLEEKPDEPENFQLKSKLMGTLYNFKQAFAADEEIWSTLNSHIQRSIDEEITFERLVILIRNILHIPVDTTAEFGLHSDSDVHDTCLYQMEKSGLLDTIIQFASETTKGTEYCFHLTEVVYLMFRDISPKTIATAKPNTYKRKLDDNDPDKKRLADLASRDSRISRGSKRSVNDYNRFNRSAQYVVKNCRSTFGDNPLLIKNPVVDRDMIKFDVNKTDLRKSKNRKPLSSETSMINSDRNTRLTRVSYGLQQFCNKFIERVFCNYMQQIKHNLIQKRTQENDETYYFWAIQFFVAFGRHSNFGINNISEILSSSTFHFNRSSITSYLDKLEVEKKKFKDTSRRLHLALRSYKELLYLLQKTKTISNHRSIFDDSEPLLLNLFHNYSEPKFSHHYLEDLIETNHIFLELVEEYEPVRSVERYSSPDVMQVYFAVLKGFKTNSDLINGCILKFFERLVKNESEVMLFQASIFRYLLEILDYPSLSDYDRFVSLTKHLFQTFGGMANKRRWMFQELLFWKNNSDVFAIKNGINPPPVVEDGEDLMNKPAADDLDLGDCIPNDVCVENSNSHLAKASSIHIEASDDDEAFGESNAIEADRISTFNSDVLDSGESDGSMNIPADEIVTVENVVTVETGETVNTGEAVDTVDI